MRMRARMEKSRVAGKAHRYVRFTKPLPFEGEALAAFKSNGVENSRSIFSR